MTISTSPTTEILDAALALARRGWYLLPTSGKTPVLEDWPNAASNHEGRIRHWFGVDAIGTPNIGIAVGKSGLVVIDVDDLSVLPALRAEFPIIDDTLTAESGRVGGGLHLYFTLPPGVVIKSRRWRPGVDVKSSGGQVIAPPSIHPTSGKAYRWRDESAEALVLPDVLVSALQQRQERSRDGDGWVPAPRGIPQTLDEGTRHEALVQILGAVRPWGLDRDEIRPMLEAVNERRAGNVGPLPAREVEALLASSEDWPVDRVMPPSLRVVREPDDDRFHFWSPGELLDADRDFRWLVGGLLVDPTYGMLAGESKTLKTHFQTMIALGVASGRTILDEFDVPEARPVTLYVGEGGRIPHTRLLERVATSMGISSLRDIDLRVSYDVAGLQSDRFRESALDDLKQREPGLVGIDPLYAFHGTDTSASSLHEEGTLLSELHAPFNDAGATLQIVNHYNKTGQGTGLRRITQAGSAEWSDSWILVTHRETGDVEAGHFHLSLEVGSRQWGGRQWDVELELGAFSTETMEFDGDIAWEVTPHGRGASSPKERQRADLRELLLGAPKTYSKTAARERVGGAVATFAEIWEEEEGRGSLRSGRIGANGAATRFEVWDWEELF